jgi:hypothetical protein
MNCRSQCIPLLKRVTTVMNIPQSGGGKKLKTQHTKTMQTSKPNQTKSARKSHLSTLPRMTIISVTSLFQDYNIAQTCQTLNKTCSLHSHSSQTHHTTTQHTCSLSSYCWTPLTLLRLWNLFENKITSSVFF